MKTRLLLALVAAAPMAAQATDGYFANGYGMKAIGMGGAAVAVAQEPFGGAVNPGAMSFLGNEWQLGVAWFQPLREASRTGSGPAGLDGAVGSESRSFIIPEFGINWKYRPDLAFGVTVYGNGGMNTDYPGGQLSAQSACAQFNPNPGPYNLLCGNGTLGVNMSQLMIAPYAAWEFTKGHSVGVAPIIAYQRFELEGMQAFDNPVLSTSSGNVTNRDQDSSWGLGVRVGYMGQLSDAIAVGVAYASKINGKFDDYRGIFAEGGGFDIPSSFSAGIAFKPTPQWLLAFDFERIWYDDAKSVNNPGALIFNCAGGQRDACLGGSNGAGFGWQNVNVFKVGVQYLLNDSWTLRAGYNHTQNPIKSSDVTFNIIAPGVVQNQWSVGTTYRIDRQSEVTGSFMFAQHNEVTGPSLLIGFGAPPTTTETIGMKQYLGGLAYSRKF
jgi:long-chain fatty acid transport protein